MDSAPRTSPVRPLVSLLALAALCTLVLLSFTQCKYAPDKVTGLDRNKPAPASSCIHDCNEQFEDSLKAENKLHKKNLKACRGEHGDGGDDGDDDGKVGSTTVTDGDGHGDGNGHGNSDPVCIAEEQARHQAAIERILAGRQACIESCHHQGGGSGGR